MGGINPCKQPGHSAATGDHGEKLTEAIFGAFSAFLESHRSIERAIISETHQNEFGAVNHAEQAQRKLGDSYDLLKRVRVHLVRYSDHLESDDEFNEVVRELDIEELASQYRQAGVISREETIWNQVGSASSSGGLPSGFTFLQDLLDQLEQLTEDAMEQMEMVPEFSSECELEPSVRYNEFPFIETNQRLLTFWQKFISAYQSVCLLSLEAFAETNDTKRPIQGSNRSQDHDEEC